MNLKRAMPGSAGACYDWIFPQMAAPRAGSERKEGLVKAKAVMLHEASGFGLMFDSFICFGLFFVFWVFFLHFPTFAYGCRNTVDC